MPKIKRLKLKTKAKWLKSEWGYPDRTLTCSNCGYEYDATDYNSKKLKEKVFSYCPNCGKRMWGVE